MGWNPQFNFKLRDDQIAFGSLILDKNGADAIADILVRFKNGEVPDLGVLKDLMDNYCFTNEEFTAMKNELPVIQADIKAFKDIGCNTLQKWKLMAQSVSINVNYVAGSDSWVERYKELKMVAADLYNQLVQVGYQFTAEEKAKYDERYGDIIGCTTNMERVSSVFEKQYLEAMLRGDPNALDNFCDCMVEAGVWTEDVAAREKNKRQLNRRLNDAEGAVNYKEQQEKKQQEEELRRQAEQEREEHLSAMRRDNYIEITIDLIDELHTAVYCPTAQQHGAEEIKWAREAIVSILRELDRECGLIANVNANMELDKQYEILVNIYTMPSRRGIIEIASIMVPEAKINRIMELTKPVEDMSSHEEMPKTEIGVDIYDTSENIDSAAINNIINDEHGVVEINSGMLFNIYDAVKTLQTSGMNGILMGMLAKIIVKSAKSVTEYLSTYFAEQLNDPNSGHAVYYKMASAVADFSFNTIDQFDNAIENLIGSGLMEFFDSVKVTVDKTEWSDLQVKVNEARTATSVVNTVVEDADDGYPANRPH